MESSPPPGEGAPATPQGAPYRHTQVGWWLLAALFAGATVVAFAASRTDWRGPALPVFGMIGAVALLFCTLTVEVNEEVVSLFFGPGLFRRRFPRLEIIGVEQVRSAWHHGWGIRFIGTGWLFSVSGLDAVEVELRGGRHVRIGTDEPRELAEAIRRLIARR